MKASGLLLQLKFWRVGQGGNACGCLETGRRQAINSFGAGVVDVAAIGAQRRSYFPKHMKGVQNVCGGSGRNRIKQLSLGAGIESEGVRVLRKRGENIEMPRRRVALNDDSPCVRNLNFAGHRRQPTGKSRNEILRVYATDFKSRPRLSDQF